MALLALSINVAINLPRSGWPPQVAQAWHKPDEVFPICTNLLQARHLGLQSCPLFGDCLQGTVESDWVMQKAYSASSPGAPDTNSEHSNTCFAC